MINIFVVVLVMPIILRILCILCILCILSILPPAQLRLLAHTIELIGKPLLHSLHISLWLSLPILDNSITAALFSLASPLCARCAGCAGCGEGVHIDQRYARNKIQQKKGGREAAMSCDMKGERRNTVKIGDIYNKIDRSVQHCRVNGRTPLLNSHHLNIASRSVESDPRSLFCSIRWLETWLSRNRGKTSNKRSLVACVVDGGRTISSMKKN